MIQVADKDGGTTTTQTKFDVVNAAPVINDLNMTGPIEASAVAPVSFGTFSFNAGDVADAGILDRLTYLWEVTTNNGQQILTSDAFAFTLEPKFSGLYTVKLTVTDSDGASTVFSQTVIVNPIAVIGMPATPTAGRVVALDSSQSSLLAPVGSMSGTTLTATRTYAWTGSLEFRPLRPGLHRV